MAPVTPHTHTFVAFQPAQLVPLSHHTLLHDRLATCFLDWRMAQAGSPYTTYPEPETPWTWDADDIADVVAELWPTTPS